MVFHRRRGTLAFSHLPQGEVADTVQQSGRHHPDNFFRRLPRCVLQSGCSGSSESNRPSAKPSTCRSARYAPASRDDARRMPKEPEPVISASCRLHQQ